MLDYVGLLLELITPALTAGFFVWFFWIVARGFIEQLPSERRKRRSRYCSICGYDLKANASGVCPECGTRFRPVLSTLQ
jgi:ribosomal protein L32